MTNDTGSRAAIDRISDDDPAKAVIEGMLSVVAQMRAIASTGETEAANRIVAELPWAVDRLLARRQRWFLVAAVLSAAGVAWTLVAVTLFWLAPACYSENGAVVCWIWLWR